MDAFVAWVAPIVATLVTLAGQLWLNGRFKRADEKRDAARAETEAKRKAEAAWRDSVDARLDKQDERSKADSGRLDRIDQRIEFIEKRLDKQEGKIDSTLEAQCTQMRSDITHKIHRYVDDLGCASTEEKQSLWAEYEVYCDICSKHGIENHFVEQMVRAAMDLPDRPKEDS